MTSGRADRGVTAEQLAAQPPPTVSFDESMSTFPPIADYAFLSDCETTALVAPSGAVEWMCIPTMDSPSVFGALLDRDAGWFRLAPADEFAVRKLLAALTTLGLVSQVERLREGKQLALPAPFPSESVYPAPAPALDHLLAA